MSDDDSLAAMVEAADWTDLASVLRAAVRSVRLANEWDDCECSETACEHHAAWTAADNVTVALGLDTTDCETVARFAPLLAEVAALRGERDRLAATLAKADAVVTAGLVRDAAHAEALNAVAAGSGERGALSKATMATQGFDVALTAYHAAALAPEPCEHLSSTGVDEAPDGPEKVWRCAACGWLHRSVPQGDGTHRTVPVAPEPEVNDE